MKKVMILTAAALLIFQANSFAQECANSCKSQSAAGFVSAPMTMEKSIVETAAGNSDFSTLVAAGATSGYADEFAGLAFLKKASIC